MHAGNPHEADPGAPGEYPRNMLERSLKEVLDPSHYQDQYGLRCYRWRTVTDRISCYGPRDAAGEDIMLTALVPPYPADAAFPEVQARYFSERYGGVRISWRTHVRNLPRWRGIDQQIWTIHRCVERGAAVGRTRAAALTSAEVDLRLEVGARVGVAPAPPPARCAPACRARAARRRSSGCRARRWR